MDNGCVWLGEESGVKMVESIKFLSKPTKIQSSKMKRKQWEKSTPILPHIFVVLVSFSFSFKVRDLALFFLPQLWFFFLTNKIYLKKKFIYQGHENKFIQYRGVFGFCVFITYNSVFITHNSKYVGPTTEKSIWHCFHFLFSSLNSLIFE